MGFVILTQASCDIAATRLAELQVLVAPIPMMVNGKQYKHYPDGRELSFRVFYEKLNSKAAISTASPSPEDFMNVAAPALEAGKDLLYLGIASTISGSYQSGLIAMKELQERFPERTILCIDTMSGAMGETLLVELAAKARAEGKTLRQTYELIEQSKYQVAHYFTLDDLDYLKRNGRLASYAATIGKILQIKPILKLNAEGHFSVAGKMRSYQKAVSRLFDFVMDKAQDLKQQIVYISHANVRQAAENLADRIRSAGAVDVVVNLLGPAIACHFGIGGIGIAFLTAHR